MEQAVAHAESYISTVVGWHYTSCFHLLQLFAIVTLDYWSRASRIESLQSVHHEFPCFKLHELQRPAYSSRKGCFSVHLLPHEYVLQVCQLIRA